MECREQHREGPGVPPQAAQVRRILVINAKGGCGKSTLATNLAGYYGGRAALIDHDPQGSSMQWLSLRDEERPPVHGVAAFRQSAGVTRSFQMRMPERVDRVILDAPAGVHGLQLIELVREVDTLLIPVQPSPIDIHAASRFIADLLLVAKVRNRAIRVGVVANRVKANTRVYHRLETFLETLDIPFVARLRDSQHYVRAAEQGLGLHELKERRVQTDLEQWQSLLQWIEG